MFHSFHSFYVIFGCEQTLSSDGRIKRKLLNIYDMPLPFNIRPNAKPATAKFVAISNTHFLVKLALGFKFF